MSGTFIVRNEVTWMPQGWIYDAILTYMADELETELAELAGQLREAQSIMGQFIDLSMLPNKEFRALFDASERAYARFLVEGPLSFVDNTGYPTLMSIFSELKAIIRTDLRINKLLRGWRIIDLAIDDRRVWSAPLWIVDLITENIACDSRLLDEELSMSLLTSPLSISKHQGGFSSLSQSQLQIVYRSSERIRARYGDGKGRTSYAPSIFGELATHVISFNTVISSDSRITDVRFGAV
jgi:hypothetical protein